MSYNADFVPSNHIELNCSPSHVSQEPTQNEYTEELIKAKILKTLSDSIVKVKMLVAASTVVPTRDKISLAMRDGPPKPTLILDLDETMVHCSVTKFTNY